jgi:hypothetical protein
MEHLPMAELVEVKALRELHHIMQEVRLVPAQQEQWRLALFG